MTLRLTRRALISGAAAVALAERAGAQAQKPLVLNDASRLNPVPVRRLVRLPANDDARLIADLRALMAEAVRDGSPLAVGGARHSLGGQSLPRAGVALSFTRPAIEPDRTKGLYRVRAGARWRDVIAALDPLGFSPTVMQSNNDFSVGGTLSVNAHGWPVPYGPFGTTVRAFRLMLADGSVVTCSPTENAELFGLVIGGYGLFGIVLDVDLAMVENLQLVLAPEVPAPDLLASRFLAHAGDPATRMLYGRLCVARRGFLQQGYLVPYRPSQVQPAALNPPFQSGAYSFVSRRLFRAQTGSELGKRIRWETELLFITRLVSAALTRNTLLNYPVATFADDNPQRTDILHEYFVPPDRFDEFLAACREIIPRHRQDLLNVTLRYVDTDPVSVMRFAPAPRIAAVLLFTQDLSRNADDDMREMTQALITRVLALGGSFYLPYRLHATQEQLHKAYPRTNEFVAKKRAYDPRLVFQNEMWRTYFG